MGHAEGVQAVDRPGRLIAAEVEVGQDELGLASHLVAEARTDGSDERATPMAGAFGQHSSSRSSTGPAWTATVSRETYRQAFSGLPT